MNPTIGNMLWILLLTVAVVIVVSWYLRMRKKKKLTSDIRTHVMNKRRIRDEEMTELVNEYLRNRYEKPLVKNWWEADTEELRKVLRQYGGMAV